MSGITIPAAKPGNRGRVGVFSQKEPVLALQNGFSTRQVTLVLLTTRTSIRSLLHPGEEKEINDHFHSKFAIIVFKVNSFSFSVA